MYGYAKGIWLLETMTTHPSTMISRVKLLQLIHVDLLQKLVSIQICQPGDSLLSQLSDNIRPTPTWFKLTPRVTDQSSEDSQD